MYGMLESTRITPRSARQDPDRLASLAEIENLREHIHHQLGVSGSAITQSTAGSQSVVREASLTTEADSSALPYEVIGDFRTGMWEGWYADGLAFGDEPVANEVLYNRHDKTFDWAGNGLASSRHTAPGVFGVLRSPNFIIEHDSLWIRMRGAKGTARIIVENYQPINGTLYGDLEDFPKDGAWKDYVIDMTIYKGMKAYVELMPGRYSMQQLHLAPEDYIEAEFLVVFSGARPDMKREAASLRMPDMLARAEKDKLIAQYDSLSAVVFDSTHHLSLTVGDPIYSAVYTRGDFKQPSEERVPHRFLTAVENSLETGRHYAGDARKSRLYWAESVVDTDNPLTARVMVNRIWHHVFGRGLVASVDNFGAQGKIPSHPELLDYLALQFVDEAWSIKKMIRHMMLTNTFQQTTMADSVFAQTDPQNVLLYHYPVRRLEAEAIRDGVLAVSGRLDLTMYGESVMLNYEPFKEFRPNIKESGPLDGDGRRSIYQELRRNYLNPMMLIFDMPVPSETVGQRTISYTPAQSLSLLNDPFFHEQAAVWAKHLVENTGEASLEERVNQMYRKAFARDATDDELARARIFLEKQAVKYERPTSEVMTDIQSWTDYGHVLFNLKEFIHLI